MSAPRRIKTVSVRESSKDSDIPRYHSPDFSIAWFDVRNRSLRSAGAYCCNAFL